jgi:hypothetical protein
MRMLPKLIAAGFLAGSAAACGPGHMDGGWELREGSTVQGYLDIRQADRSAPLSPDILTVHATLRGQDIVMGGSSLGAGFEIEGPGCRESTRTCADTVWYFISGSNESRIRNDFDADLSVWATASGPYDSRATALERQSLHGHRVR